METPIFRPFLAIGLVAVIAGGAPDAMPPDSLEFRPDLTNVVR